MAFRFNEKPGASRSTSTPPTLETQYVAAGIFDRGTVKAYALSLTPSIVAVAEGLLYRQDIEVSERGYKLYDVAVRYATKDKSSPPTGQFRFSASSQGGTVHRTHSLETVAAYPSGARDFKKGIGAKIKDSKIEFEGADVTVPSLKFSFNFRHPNGFFNLAQANALSDITGTVNESAFLGSEAGELLFLGFDGSDGSDSEAEVTYHFSKERNLSGLTFGSVTGVSKDGHDLLWVLSQDDVDGGEGVSVPIAVYVERVFPRVDFAAVLGFG